MVFSFLLYFILAAVPAVSVVLVGAQAAADSYIRVTYTLGVLDSISFRWRELVARVFLYFGYTFLAAASFHLTQAILTSYCSSSSSHQPKVSFPTFCPPRPGGLAFGHRAAFASCPRTSGCLAGARHRNLSRRSTQRLGISSIAVANVT